MSEENKNPETKEPEVEMINLLLFKVNRDGSRVSPAKLKVPKAVGEWPLYRPRQEERNAASRAYGVRINLGGTTSTDIASAIKDFNDYFRNNHVLGCYHIELDVESESAEAA